MITGDDTFNISCLSRSLLHNFAVRITRQTNLTEEIAWETDSGSACQGIPSIWLNRKVQLPCPGEPAIEINCLFTPITHITHRSTLIHHTDNSLCRLCACTSSNHLHGGYMCSVYLYLYTRICTYVSVYLCASPCKSCHYVAVADILILSAERTSHWSLCLWVLERAKEAWLLGLNNVTPVFETRSTLEFDLGLCLRFGIRITIHTQGFKLYSGM